MSADNWAHCPICVKKAEDAIAIEENRIHSLYGKVTPEEYYEIFTKFKNKSKETKKETLREDYELGIFDGKFNVSYRGRCEECGFNFKYIHTNVSIDQDYKVT